MSRPDDPDPHDAAAGETIRVFGHPAAIAAADARALSEIAAGRVISHVAVCCWIGHWGGSGPCHPAAEPSHLAAEPSHPQLAMSLVWSEGAIADLEHIRRYLTAFDPAAARRFADRITVAAEVLERQAAALAQGIGQRQTLPPFTLRYHAAAGGLAIMWVRQTEDDAR